jgi:hypothetical protein
MKKLAAFTVVALALVLPAQAASADLLDLGTTGDLTAGVFPDDQFSALGSSGYPFAVGGGTTADASRFAFSAHLGPKGPSGYAVIKTILNGEAQGNVVCYRTRAPNVAAEFEIQVQKGSGLAGSALFLHFVVDDLGEPSSATSDQLVVHTGDGNCRANADFIAGGVVTQGNVVVKN